MADQFENKTIDKRVVHRYVRKGIVDEKEYAQHIKSLPDLEAQALEIESAMDGELDDEDDDET
jgi:hypothetical protein